MLQDHFLYPNTVDQRTWNVFSGVRPVISAKRSHTRQCTKRSRKRWPPNCALRAQSTNMFWVSCWLRVFRKKGPKPRRRKELWQADFDRVTEQLRNDPDATIIRPRVGRLISSFVLIFPALWGFLVALHAAGILRNELVVQCDHTFVIEWQGYAWGMLGFVFHRRIAGYWRRSFVPLMMNCRPVETAASYLVMFQILKDELKYTC